MAQVFRGTDEVLRRSIAVKVLHPHLAADDTFVTRFRHEAIAVARLSHPAIVNVYDTCSENGVEAIVMELVRGNTLRDRLDEGPLDPWAAANIAAQVAGALDVAHAAGLVHRDIKPANILLSEDGRVKVGDFGIAKAAESADLTQEGSFVGTAKYLAPEQVESKPVDGRTDLYSLGVVLYEMLCGRVPFEGDSSSATALARLHQDPQRPRLIRPGIPRPLEAITMRLLARTPDDRYPTAADVRAALLGVGADDRVADAEPTGSMTAPVGPPVAPPRHTPSRGLGAAPIPPPPPPGQAPVRFAETERRWLVPTLLVILVAVALGIAGLLIGRSALPLGDDDVTTDSSSATTAEPTGTAVPIAETIDYDPAGTPTPQESPRQAAQKLAADGDPETAWDTERYNDRELTSIRPGVGLIFELEQPADISKITIQSPSVGWRGEVYVADAPPEDLEDWGDPVVSIDGDGTNPLELAFESRSAGAVLVWITYVGEDHKVELNEVTIST
jgi:eukaryotic-like serine/threonine-protein kinase